MLEPLHLQVSNSHLSTYYSHPSRRWCIPPPQRQVLLVKCQGLHVFTSSVCFLGERWTVLPSGDRASPEPPPLWHRPSLKCSFDGTFVQHDSAVGELRDECVKTVLSRASALCLCLDQNVKIWLFIVMFWHWSSSLKMCRKYLSAAFTLRVLQCFYERCVVYWLKSTV